MGRQNMHTSQNVSHTSPMPTQIIACTHPTPARGQMMYTFENNPMFAVDGEWKMVLPGRRFSTGSQAVAPPVYVPAKRPARQPAGRFGRERKTEWTHVLGACSSSLEPSSRTRITMYCGFCIYATPAARLDLPPTPRGRDMCVCLTVVQCRPHFTPEARAPGYVEARLNRDSRAARAAGYPGLVCGRVRVCHVSAPMSSHERGNMRQDETITRQGAAAASLRLPQPMSQHAGSLDSAASHRHSLRQFNE